MPEMSSKEVEKFWADIWEAWWCAICTERELWHETLLDIHSYFRRLIILKYSDLYSTVYRVDRTPFSENIRQPISRDQIQVTPLAADANIRTSIATSNSPKSPYGYIASVPYDLGQFSSIYDVREDD